LRCIRALRERAGTQRQTKKEYPTFFHTVWLNAFSAWRATAVPKQK
jgi:hypothetical protein